MWLTCLTNKQVGNELLSQKKTIYNTNLSLRRCSCVAKQHLSGNSKNVSCVCASKIKYNLICFAHITLTGVLFHAINNRRSNLKTTYCCLVIR